MNKMWFPLVNFQLKVDNKSQVRNFDHRIKYLTKSKHHWYVHNLKILSKESSTPCTKLWEVIDMCTIVYGGLLIVKEWITHMNIQV